MAEPAPRPTPGPRSRRDFLRTAGVGAVAVFGGAFLVVGCSDDDKKSMPTPVPTAPGQAKLYDRLGGNPAITAVVDAFVANVAADTRINHFFARTDIPTLKMHLVNQIGEATGGPEKYTGRDMKTAHAGLMITKADFDALVEDLVKALDQFKVPEKEKNELLGLLGPMQNDIVTA
jgi:hemoglobin